MEWITKMNEMLESNPYTNDKRVTVVYSEESEGVFVTVNGKTSIIMWEGLTEYGLMIEIVKTIDRLYNQVWPLIGIRKYFCMPIERLNRTLYNKEGIDNMKDVRMRITMETCDNIVNSLQERNYDVEYVPGGTLDNYFCEVGESNLKLSRWKLRKYLIVLERFVNTWTSTLELILTDNAETYYNLYNSYMESYTENVMEE